MPLLKKTFKKNLSSTTKTNFKGFVTPLKNKHKIADIINNLNEHSTKKSYNAFVERLEGKYDNRSSSPYESIHFKHIETKENTHSKKNKTNGIINENEIGRELSLDTEDSFSQEQLNQSKVKAAYVEFMNNSLVQENNVEKKGFLICNNSSEEVLDFVKKSVKNGISRTNSKEVSKKKNKNMLVNLELAGPLPQKNVPRTNSKEKIKNGVVKELDVGRISRTKLKEKNKNLTSKINLPEGITNLKTSKSDTKKKLRCQKRLKNSEQNVTSVDQDNDDGFKGLTPDEKMNKIYEKRNVGLYVLCDKCNKSRYLPHVVDPLDLPDKWYCHMNPDRNYNKCTYPEKVDEDEEFLIDNTYNAGSIVYVKMDGYPWWPAMVDDCPDIEDYFWLEGNSTPTYYHVTFFDSMEVTRAWLRPSNIQPFKKNLNKRGFQIPDKHRYKARLIAAFKQAMDAIDMPLLSRLKTYGFIKRYKKPQKRFHRENSSKQNRSKKRKTSLIDDAVSEILGDVNLLDISFNFLE